MNKHRRKWKRGISLAEVVVAMLVITIVSAAAITTVEHSLNFTSRVVSSQESRAAALNALECFKFCTNESEFNDNYYRCGQFKRDYAETTPNETAYMYKAAACVTKVFINYSAARPTFRAVCTDNKGSVVFQIEYTKAG